MESPSASGTEEKDTMNKDSISNGKDSVTVQASIQIGKREFVIGTKLPKTVFYDIVSQLCEIATQSMLDDGLRSLAEDISEFLDFQADAEEGDQ